jgi:N-acetylmuramoyl-L-alanine amidase
MKTRRIIAFFLIVFFSLLDFSVDIFSADTILGDTDRYDSYAFENSRMIMGDGFEISLDSMTGSERVGINVSQYGKSSVVYKTSSNCIEYTYTGTSGSALSVSSYGQFSGTYLDHIAAKRTQGSTSLVISVYLKNDTVYTLEDATGWNYMLLEYTDEYQSYVDGLQLLREQAEAKLLEISSTSLFSEGFLNRVLTGNTPAVPLTALQAEYLLDEQQHIASLKIPGLKLVDEAGNQLYETRYLGETKYLIKFDSSLGNVNVQQVNTDDYLVKRISISTDNYTKKTTIVIESEGKLIYKRNTEYDATGFEIDISTIPIPDALPQDEITEPNPDANTGSSDLDNSGYTDNIYGVKLDDLNINYTNRSPCDEVAIDLAGASSYSVHRMTEPERIVIDIKGIDLTSMLKTINVNSPYIEKIRYAHFDNNTARVVIDLKNPAGYSDSFSPQNSYTYEIKNGKLYVNVGKRLFGKFFYSNMGDRIYLLMVGEYLTSSEYSLAANSLYTSSYNAVSGLYTISYDSIYSYNGRMNINDASVDYIEISTVAGRATMKIQFKDKSLVPLPITRYMKSGSSVCYWHSTITFLKPKQAGEKVIVLDPGHGGADPGAVANGVEEKDLNLDIAKRLKELFKGSGVRVYLTRCDDSFVGLGERTAAANILKADLFLAIHNNAYYSSSNGTETFYYTYSEGSSGIAGPEFAGIIQKHLVADLGLYNRGVFANSYFSVLKNSDMTSALAEIGFVTNLNDVAKLKDPAFRQKAAIALYKAINESLAKIR